MVHFSYGSRIERESPKGARGQRPFIFTWSCPLALPLSQSLRYLFSSYGLQELGLSREGQGGSIFVFQNTKVYLRQHQQGSPYRFYCSGNCFLKKNWLLYFWILNRKTPFTGPVTASRSVTVSVKSPVTGDLPAVKWTLIYTQQCSSEISLSIQPHMIELMGWTKDRRNL